MSTQIAPWLKAEAFTANDSFPLAYQTDGIYVGDPGSMAVRWNDGTETTFPSLTAGFHPISPRFILATGTTASDILIGQSRT